MAGPKPSAAPANSAQSAVAKEATTSAADGAAIGRRRRLWGAGEGGKSGKNGLDKKGGVCPKWLFFSLFLFVLGGVLEKSKGCSL